MSTQALYEDTALLSENVNLIAVRDGSVEMNSYESTIYGYRVNVLGCWGIVSHNKYDKDLLNKLKHVMIMTITEPCGEFSEAELYKGNVTIGKEFPDADGVLKLIYDLCGEAKGYNATRCEIIAQLKTIKRVIERGKDDIAEEQRLIAEAEIAVLGTTSYGIAVAATNYVVTISWSSKHVLNQIESAFKEAMDKMIEMSALKPLKPYLYGKTNVILDHTASAAVFHEVSHMLDPTYSVSRRILGYRLFSEDVEVYDDPLNSASPSIRFFDDEGVSAKRRLLVDKGVVRDMHQTRTTAKPMESEPGSAYGLFSRPVPFHTTLVVKPGDWKHSEIVEETDRGFYVKGVAMTALEEGYIRLVPEYGYLVEGGELKEAVKIREVRIPIRALKTINALTRDTKTRSSYEKMWLVSEIAPMVRLEAYVQ